MTIIPTIIEQHAEEAAFLWLQREAAVHDPHYDLKDLAKLEDRIEAHIDGLLIAGDAGWGFCQQAIQLEEPGEVFAAAVLCLGSGEKQRLEEVISAACTANENWRGLLSATGWLGKDQLDSLLADLFKSEQAEKKRLGVGACAIHRHNPGDALAESFEDPEALFQARAFRAVGELKRRDLLADLQPYVESENNITRFWAAWSAVLLGDRKTLDILFPFSLQESPQQERAIQLIFRVLNDQQSQIYLNELTQEPSCFRQAVIASGVTGDPLHIPWLIKLTQTPELARVAGEAFAMITGVDIAFEDLEGEWPEGFEAGPTENPEDDDVEMDPDEDLPWPNPELISNWWNSNKGNFRNGTRYLVGKPITEEQCQHVLRYGYQRQRAAAALELALMHPDEPLFNVCAPGFRQKQLLGLK